MGNISADIRKYVANLKAERDDAKAEIARLRAALEYLLTENVGLFPDVARRIRDVLKSDTGEYEPTEEDMVNAAYARGEDHER